MRVEILYFQGCPNYEPAVKRVRAVLDDEGVTTEILAIEVCGRRAADALRFPGSPSVRVNGIDVEGPLAAGGAVGLSCRTYMNGALREGIPPAEVIRDAIRKAKDASP